MNFKKIIFLFLLNHTLNANELSIEGQWYSEKKEFRNGFESMQLFVEDKKFILSKLTYNEEKKWEEMRVLGILKKKDTGEIILAPEMCTVYAAKNLGMRWVLIQGFDCDHLEIQITKNEQGIFISPSVGIEENLLIQKVGITSRKQIQGKVVFIENEFFYVWSLSMRYVRKGARAFLNKKPVTVVETVDSTGKFETKERVNIGDSLEIQNVESSIFD